jgi:hypothetical protein
MDRKNAQQYEMLARVADFAANNAGFFPKNTAAPQIVAALTSAVTKLSDEASTRVTAEAEIRTSRRARITARETLRTRLDQAEQTGRTLNSDQFRAPSQRTDRAWIHSGRAFAEAAGSLKKEFAQHGLPQFTDTMNAAVASLEEAVLGHARSKLMRSRAVRDFDETMKEALGYVHSLDTIVANTLSDDPNATASWTATRSVIQTGGRRGTRKPPCPPPSPASSPAPSPAPSPEVVTPTPVAA